MESAARTDLNERATRVSAVLDPVKLIVTNYPEGQVEELEMQNNPERPEEGTHTIEFSRELWIERADFKEEADKKFFRMTPGKETRLKGAYIVECTGCKKNEATGEIEEIYCTYDPSSKAGTEGSNRKVKGTIHWLSVGHCLPAEVRNYACLWTCENPRDAIKEYEEANGVRGIDAMRPFLNPNSISINKRAFVEKFLLTRKAFDYLQFTRTGYYNVDPDSTPEHLIFNSTVSLKEDKHK